MKKLVFFTLVILAVVGSYLAGAIAGFDKGWIYAQSINVHHASADLTGKMELEFNNLAEMEQSIEQTNRLAIKNGLIEYGRYINKVSSKLPLPFDVGDTTIAFYRDAAQVYVDQLVIQNAVVESSEEIVNRVEQEMMGDGVLDMDVWKAERHVFLASLKEQEASLNMAIEYLTEN